MQCCVTAQRPRKAIGPSARSARCNRAIRNHALIVRWNQRASWEPLANSVLSDQACGIFHCLLSRAFSYWEDILRLPGVDSSAETER